MKNRLNQLALICTAILIAFAAQTNAQKNYSGKAWNGKIQQIPGKIQCELYDTGGEGVAYHDTDSVNNGSGRLNPANGTLLNEFRMNEGVDISYTKFQDPAIDNNAFNLWNLKKTSIMRVGLSPASGLTTPSK
ncbi:MAG: hypothetical protein IPF54_00650 [Draconibacterium sp.]|nr:hypothetical protein [Draconibacterium sp.]